ISCMFVPLGTALTLGPAGKIRPIAGSAKERSPLAPDLPSLHESGVKGFHYTSWFSAWGPAGMAPQVVTKYNAAFREILSEAAVRDALAKHGVSVKLSTPEELDRLNREDYGHFVKLIKDAK